MKKTDLLVGFFNLLYWDAVGALDVIQCADQHKSFLDKNDKLKLDILSRYRFRKDVFRNVEFCLDFVIDCLNKYACLSVLLDYDPKISDGFMSNLLTYQNVKKYVNS